MICVSKLPPSIIPLLTSAGFDSSEDFWDIKAEDAFAEVVSNFNGGGSELVVLLDSLRAADESKIGPKGQDQGDFHVAFGHAEGNVIVDFFGKQVSWFGMAPQMARDFAANMVKHADLVEEEAH
jgi:hypothetical protein